MKRTLALLFLSVFVGLACNAGQQDLKPDRPAAIVELVPPTTQPALKDEDAQVRAALKAKLPKIDFDDTEFSSVVTFLREVSGLNISPNWAVLDSAGVGGGNAKSAKVGAHLTNVTFEKALGVILTSLGNGGQTPLSFTVDKGVINISTHEDLSQHAVTRTYEVRDLASVEPLSSKEEEDAFELSEKLMNIIKNTIAPESWRPNGQIGDIEAYEGTLVVTNVEDVHRNIEELLASLRQARYPQWQLELTQKLRQTAVRVDFQNARLGDAVDALRSVCGVNIVLAPALNAKAPPPITLKANNVTLKQVLNLVARMEGVNWALADGAVYISRAPGDVPAQQATAAQPSPPGPLTKAVLLVEAKNLKGTVVTAHLDQEIPRNTNVLWCASFQLAWNELMDFAAGPVEMPEGPAMIGALNQRAFDKKDIDDASLVAVAGLVGDGVLAKAREELARKFPKFETRLLPADNAWGPQDTVMYACLIKQLPFEYPFGRFSRDAGGIFSRPDSGGSLGENFSSFGLHGFSPGDLQEVATAAQVRILWHRFEKNPAPGEAPEHFIVELLTKAREDRLILAMIPPKRTLTQTVDEATTLMANPNTMMLKRISLADEALRAKPEIISKYACLFPKENLNVPVLDFDILREFTELCHKPVKCKNPKLNGQPCVAALQTIRFCLNENGAKLESEALGMFSSGAEPTHRDFTFNRPFLVMLMRKGSTKPYFAAWIANDELLVHEPDVPETTQPTTEKNK